MTTPPAPKHHGAQASVTLGDLSPGAVVERWTDPGSGGRYWAPLPCHERQQVLLQPDQQQVAVCRDCSRSYQVCLWDDGGGLGSFTATFTVTYQRWLLSRLRPARKDT